MMTSLFSSFDPSTSSNLSLNWLSALIFVMLLPTPMFMKNSRSSYPFWAFKSHMKNELKTILSKTFTQGAPLILISLMVSIMLNNLFGLLPFIFTSTSHMVTSLALAFPLWISFLIFGWIKNTKKMLIHLLPVGTPFLLMPLMVLIETVSNLIRPITLSIRLTANMIAGHLLLTLLGNQSSIDKMTTPFLIPIQMTLMTLESAVAMIQAYVFVVLISLYSAEAH